MARLVAVAAALLVGPLVSVSRAQEVPCDDVGEQPCSFGLQDLHVEAAPPVFRFQARVGQAGLPLGDQTFATVYVKVLRAGEVVCMEQLDQVQVVSSVLNLEIGRDMSCDFPLLVASESALALQICPGGVDTCLKPVSFGAVPYAVKASFASITQQAARATRAGQAHYAHRFTADRDTMFQRTLFTGYFDMATPSASQCLELYPTAADFGPYAQGGWLTWTPTGDRAALRVHISGKDADTDHPVALARLVLASEDTYATGDLTVTPPAGGKGLTVTGAGAHVTGDVAVEGQLVVTGRADVRSGGVHAGGDSEIDGPARVAGRVDVEAGGLHVQGDSEIGGRAALGGRLTVQAGGLHVTGDSAARGRLTTAGPLTVQAGGADVTGASQVAGQLAVQGGLRVQSGGLAVTGDLAVTDALGVGQGLRVAAGGAGIAGDATVGGGLSATGAALVTGSLSVAGAAMELAGSLTMSGGGAASRVAALTGAELGLNPDGTLTQVLVRGGVRFKGHVTFDAGKTDPSAAQAFVHATGETRDLTLGGSLTVQHAASFSGAVVLPGGLSGDLVAQGDLSVAGAASCQAGLTVAGASSLSGAATHGAAVTFQGPVSFPGGVQGSWGLPQALTVVGAAGVSGDLQVAGAAGLAGSATFTQAATVAGEARAASLYVTGGTTLDGAASFVGGVSGPVGFGGTIRVTGTTTLGGAATVGGALSIDGETVFNGPINLSGSFTGLTRFENMALVATAGTALRTAPGSTAVFEGAVDIQGTVAGTTTFDTFVAGTGVTVAGSASFAHQAVDFQGGVAGLNLPQPGELVIAQGETRTIQLQSLILSGAAIFQQKPAFVAGLGDVAAAHFTATGPASASGSLNALGCRWCLNYADTWGTGSPRHACARLSGSGTPERSGLMNLLGNVDDNDVIELRFLCDGGPSEQALGWL